MSRAVIQATWDDVPHLTAQDKSDLLASMPVHQRDARSKGVPSLGAGAIYPISEDEIKCDPFSIPDHWPRAYGMDVGWNCTAAIWGAWDRDTDTRYLYAEHSRGQAEPSIHAAAIKARGDWICGAIDPASRGRSQKDGQNLLENYEDLGLLIKPANNSVESGVYQVWDLLSTGRLKVFSTLQNFFKEYRLYRRDDKGKIVKQNDHVMDATRYLVMTGFDCATVKPSQHKRREAGDWRL